MEAPLKDIRAYSLEELTAYFQSIGEKPFRAKQVFDWLWQKSAVTFEEMTNLSLALREKLAAHFEILNISLATSQISSDGTIKNAFRLHDGHIIEGVLIPTEGRMTACVSSQVGCSLTCRFCATGKMDRIRNLEAGEIYDQIVFIRNQAMQQYNIPLTNIVYMGMGEPLLNYQHVKRSVELVTDQSGLGMASRRITVSTAGIAKMIRKLGDDKVKFNLALSLHAANDVKRSKIMPINDSNSLEALREALIYYHQQTDSAITFEYIVFKDFNDSLDDARELAAFAEIVPVKINLIEYNPIDQGEFNQTTAERLEAFKQFLWEKGLQVNIRRSRGKDIDAACGQLANKSVTQ